MNHNPHSHFRRSSSNGAGRNRATFEEGSFQCRRCHNHVLLNPLFSGVRNRNHCPYCLWSRHVDLHRAGDRLSACKADMQPVGLTLKKTPKKYGAAAGELMIIHRCIECGAISINRLAADDDPEGILRLVPLSGVADLQLHEAFIADGIQPLANDDADLVRLRLYGWCSCTRPPEGNIHPSGRFSSHDNLRPIAG